MQDFKNVDIWKKSHALTLSVYQATRSLPKEEMFGISFQLRRTVVSIASRIAEGCGRETNAEFAIDLRRSGAVCNELEYLILVAKDLELWGPEVCEQLTVGVVEVRKMIFGLLRKM